MPAVLAIADAVVAQLNAASIANGRVFQVFPVESAAAGQGVVVRVLRSLPRAKAIRGNPIAWDTVLQLKAFDHYGLSNQRPHEGLVTLAGAAFAAIFADESLGGLIDGMLAGPVSFDYDTNQGDGIGTCDLMFTLLHQTDYGVM